MQRDALSAAICDAHVLLSGCSRDRYPLLRIQINENCLVPRSSFSIASCFVVEKNPNCNRRMYGSMSALNAQSIFILTMCCKLSIWY